jgi:hypothetical protein
MLTEALRERQRWSRVMSALRFSRTLLVHTMIWGAGVVVPAVLAEQAKAGADSAPTPYQTGLAAWQRGDITAAHNAFERTVRLNPRSADSQNMLGHALLAVAA